MVHSDGLNIVNKVIVARHYQAMKENNPEAYRLLVESLTRVVNLGSKVEADQSAELALARTSLSEH